MKLQKLEIKGFKSFANETVIHFNESVTGVIGPNGSGKSNIVDAIRWVLGEQSSRELRLERMSNVLFNGTKKRKAAGLAQVALTFENTRNILPTEYQTVTISRHLYRTGESEYRINNVTCRLKDIKSLFLDTGIGSNSYAIIALSMVDDILNDHEQSRRRMIEQAAGVSKYKARKSETLRKLSHTEADLNRVEDLLFEIEHNLKSLEKQARKAQKYLDIKAEYKERSIDWAVYQTHDLKTRYKKIANRLEQEENQLRELDIAIKKSEARTEQEKLRNIDKEKALSERQKSLNAVADQIRRLENQLEILDQRHRFTEQNRSKLQERIRFNAERMEQLRKDLTYYQQKLAEAQGEVQKGEQELRAAEQDLGTIRQEHGSIKNDLDVYLQELSALERGIYELEKQRAINLNQIENLESEIRRNEEVLQQRGQESTDLRSAVQEIAEKEAGLRKEVAFLETEEDKRLETIRKADEDLQQQNQRLSQINRQLDALRNEHKLTKSMVENLEGFPESIKYLNQQKSWPGAPLLSDILTSPEEVRVAIEQYLDHTLSFYVVPDLSTASGALQLLQKNQKGKANFYLLDAFDDTRFETPELPGLTRVIDLIEVDAPYRKLVEYLFYQVYLGDGDQVPPQRPDAPDAIILGSSGSWTRRRFSLSGGSVGLFEGKKLGRKKNLEKLDKQIRKLEQDEAKQIQKVQSVKQHLQELKGANQPERIRQAKGELDRATQRLITLQTRLENADKYQQEVVERNQQATTIIAGLTDRNRDLDKELLQRRQEEADFRKRMEDTDQSYKTVAEALNQRSSAYNEKNIRYIQLQNKVQGYQQEYQFREEQVQETTAALEQDQKAAEQASEELTTMKGEEASLQTKLHGLFDEKKIVESHLTQAEQDYFQARGQINEIEKEVRLLHRQRQDAQLLVNELKDNYNTIRLDLTTIGERIKVEFQTSIQEIINRDPAPDLDPEKLRLQVERLQKRLANYGEVNPMAVEAYQEMQERYETIDTQRKDILEAKDSLLQTIEEIEDTATRQFLAAFEQVRENFQTVFRSLFTEEDSSNLVLEDPENPLESIIHITAKPKGKRPQSINQLSGGEKTLTATAFLFALYLLKPAPFCIFDEVDAPLDDSNIEKFNKIIQNFSENSQFIIVTHNKLTMASVDVLYGVYMREQGISAVAPVDFRTYEHNAVMETVSA